ncbi:MAG: hypothetical protein WCF84_06000 [Anaerolineae bacterium]
MANKKRLTNLAKAFHHPYAFVALQSPRDPVSLAFYNVKDMDRYCIGHVADLRPPGMLMTNYLLNLSQV